MEISPSLAKKQLETVGEVQSHLSRFSVERRDATNKAGWGKLYLASQFYALVAHNFVIDLSSLLLITSLHICG